MTSPRAIVVKAPGTNCDVENADALRRAGAEAEVVPTTALLEEPERILDARILCFAGGFAHGDDVASARILATQLRLKAGDVLREFVDERGGYVLGICNGFQALCKLGLLPREPGAPIRQTVSVVHNDSGHYECRWVRMRVENSPCAFLTPGEELYMPVGHGEGKFVPGPEFDAANGGLVSLRYIGEDGSEASEYPQNPNGSIDAIAGICDSSGHVFGLMPHPDRSYLAVQHPRRLQESIRDEDMAGMKFFVGLVNAAR